MPAPDKPEPDKLTVYVDRSCALCRAEIEHYAAQEGAEKLQFVDVSAPDAQPGEDLSRDAAMARFHVRSADGLVSGAAAFVAVWSALPRWRWAARLARLPGVTPLLELGYRLFLPIRPAVSRQFGKLQRRRQSRR